MKKYYFLFLAFVFLGCKATVTFLTEPEIKYIDSYFSDNKDNCINDRFIYCKIPDKYNTGANEKTKFSYINTSGLFNNVYITVDTRSGKDYLITSYIPKNIPEMPSKVIIEDCDFSDGDFRIYNPDRYSENKTIFFKNCKFKGFRNAGPYDNNKVTCIFDHCSFYGGVNEVNIKMNWCKIGHFPSDAMNPLKNFTVENSFIYDLSCEGNNKGTHIDGFQIYGRENIIGGNIYINNLRFEIPSIYYENNNSYVNACVMLQLEYGNVENCTFDNLICNGGGKWFPLYFKKTKSKVDGTYFKKGEEFPQKNIYLSNVKVSNNFGTIFYPTEHYHDAPIENVEHLTNLYVSSIFKGDDGFYHIICTNDTSFDKVLTVVTDNDIFTFEIPHCPSNWALGGEIDMKVNPNENLTDKDGKSYKDYKYKDLPFDVDCVINRETKKISCYDGDMILCDIK